MPGTACCRGRPPCPPDCSPAALCQPEDPCQPGDAAASRSSTCLMCPSPRGEQDVVVALPRPDHLEREGRDVRQIKRPPTLRVAIRGWRSRMECVPEMDGHVPRLGGEGDHRHRVGLIGARKPRDPPVRTGDHEELSGSGGRRVELDADVQHRALDGVPAHAAVAVPGQIGEARLGTGDLDHDTVAVEAVRRVAKVGATHSPYATEPLVISETSDETGLVVQVVDAVAGVLAVDRRPPRTSVLGLGV